MKKLVIYYSWDETTKSLAEKIANEHDADIFCIEAANPYPIDRHQLCQRAISELDDDARPAFLSSPDIEKYDTIYIGSPIWIWHLPQLVKHFLVSHDWTGKQIIPFCTCLYEGEQKAIDEILLYTGAGGNALPHTVHDVHDVYAYIAE